MQVTRRVVALVAVVVLTALATTTLLREHGDDTSCREFLAMAHDEQVETLRQEADDLFSRDPAYYVDACDTSNRSDLEASIKYLKG